MKSKEYIEEMKNIKPSEELIQKTISNIKQIKEVEKMKKSIGIKRILIGATAFMALSAGTVGAYAAYRKYRNSRKNRYKIRPKLRWK